MVSITKHPKLLANEIRPRNMHARPTAYTKSDIAGALRSLGYTRWGEPLVEPGHIPAVDLVVALVYSRDMRWIYSAIPVVLCRGSFNWVSMAKTAKAYGFGGILHGFIQQLREVKHMPESRVADDILADCTPIKPQKLKDVLRVYGC